MREEIIHSMPWLEETLPKTLTREIAESYDWAVCRIFKFVAMVSSNTDHLCHHFLIIDHCQILNKVALLVNAFNLFT